jgi:NAD(P)-dependent dehydrogenase (short-subunit alcohol dehydrogenase family)
MLSLDGKNVAVIGASRGVGRQIVEAAARNGAHVLAIARHKEPLEKLAEEVRGVDIMPLDATEESAPAQAFDRLVPDILVVCAGAFPPAAPLHKLEWREFAVNWETDVKIAFNFLRAALSLPLPADSSVILVSSGAALAGSPNSGGYAGAKRTQMFMANYSQKESDRLGLGLRFMTLAPRMIPDTELGKHAVAGYSRYLGIPAADFIQSMNAPPSAADVANAAVLLATNPDQHKGQVFIVSGKGVEAARL